MAKAPIYVAETTEPIGPEHRAQSCTGKIRHRKRGAAKQEARRLYQEVGAALGPLAIYQCAYCRGWHVGKSTKLILSRVRIVA